MAVIICGQGQTYQLGVSLKKTDSSAMNGWALFNYSGAFEEGPSCMAYDADRLTGMPDMIIRSKDGSHAHLPPFGGLQCPREEAVEISGIFAAKKAPPTRQLRDQTVRRDLLTRGQHSAAQPSRHMVPYPSHVVLHGLIGKEPLVALPKLDRGCVLSSAEELTLNAGLLDDSSADRTLRRTNPVLFQSGCHARAPPRCRNTVPPKPTAAIRRRV